ncbi:YdbH domain-containing protein [Colwellia sp. 6_MG-2023]|uniref:YdbH domain-containing protein n=1 Tax=Colwellia sp. 6_MG-2023 TaxID=3062676 RepID=UPI0026E4428E|nr:YdbH domain-containing protein [Colwellia sp. 6_MG-2023]MDO6486697.1 YdbH domain-containing protein [Colwellia sp. 6_MG-2023]
MRFFKLITITLVSLFIIVTVIFAGIYNARISIINNIAQNQFSLVPVKATCFEFSLTSDLSIAVDNLCLQSPKADINIVDTIIQWQYSPFNITNIDVNLLEINAKEHFFSNINQVSLNKKESTTNESINDLLSTTLRTYVEQIKQLQLPLNLNVEQISYLPFTAQDKTTIAKGVTLEKAQSPYIAQISSLDNTWLFSLKNQDNIAFANLTLVHELAGFSITFSSELEPLKTFVSEHRLPISTRLQQDLNAHEVTGSISSLIKYQADKLSMENHITGFVLNSATGIGDSGAFKLSGELNFNNQFDLDSNEVNSKNNETFKKNNNTSSNNNNEALTLQFIEQNELLLEYQQVSLLALLERIQVSPIIMSVMKDNPIPRLALKLQGDAVVNFIKDELKLSYLEMNAGNDEVTHQVVLDNSAVALANTERFNAFTVEDFVLDSEVNLISIPSIAKLTTTPINIHLAGSLQSLNNQARLNLAENSVIELNNIKVVGNSEQGSQTLFSVKALSTELKGHVALLEDNKLHMNISVLNKAKQMNVPKAIQVNSFELFSEVKGSLDDISIKTSTNADGVDLGNIFITGTVQSPAIEVIGTGLPLTDLLSLNIKLPISVELIEGTLNYNVSGQLPDLNHITQTHFDANVGIKSLSGEVDGIWLQDLNWQQQFTIESGNITTNANDKENITIALIESFTPISNLSVNTRWSFSDNNFKLAVNNLKADAFSGSIFVPDMHWPFVKGHSANVQLDSIDLAQVLALDKKQGIVVTGDISGQIPVMFDGDKLIIEAGELYNVSNGLIQVINNPAVAELKANNSQLQLAFDALQNLHYHQLSSTVSMLDDGYMQLDTIIKGRNPDIDNDVNLNLNLTYDLLGLLESLSITQRFEEIIIKGLQKNKE